MSNSGLILIADDDRAIRTVLSQALTRAGFQTRSTGTCSTLYRWIEEGEGDAVITDVMMPDGDSLDMLPSMKRRRPKLPFIVMSAQNTVMTAIRAAEAGAYEYLPKPFDLQELIAHVRKAMAGSKITEDAALEGREDPQPLVGRSPAMQDVYRVMARLMNTDLTVMISGESGTGKELVARALHDYGRRKTGPFIAVNMAAIPRDLIESELFGHEKGSFTGATSKSRGKFELARGGTLFLDEIGDMPAEAQTRLLRVLQEGEFTSVGAAGTTKTDVRIIAATHQDLRNLSREGLFREDLYYRLNVAPIRLPPIRERLDDVPDLARTFLRDAASEGLPRKTISKSAMEALKSHSWPGNVRELQNLVKRLAVLCPDEIIDKDSVETEIVLQDSSKSISSKENNDLSGIIEVHLKQYFATHGGSLPAPGLYQRILREIEFPLIALSLAATRGNQLKAADMLGLNRNTLRKKIRELDIPVERRKK